MLGQDFFEEPATELDIPQKFTAEDTADLIDETLEKLLAPGIDQTKLVLKCGTGNPGKKQKSKALALLKEYV